MTDEENQNLPRKRRIAYVDHSYHRATLSTAFFPEILARDNQVDTFWDESWRTNETDRELVRTISEGDYDVIVLFQVFWRPEILLEFGLDNVVMIPMYDAVRLQGNDWWATYAFCRTLIFSKTLHRRLSGLGIESKFVQYFPEPSVCDVSGSSSGSRGELLRGFFWQRTDQVLWRTIRKLGEGSNWEEFFLHWVPDPGHESLPKPTENERKEWGVRMSEWFDTRGKYLETVNKADVYFAPRGHEGIGLGFLEAMALGKCVVAPDTPTHNEYIVHGENGLLYDLDNPQPLDLSRAREMGEAARETCLAGWENWRREQEELIEFVCRDAPSGWERQLRLLRHEITISRRAKLEYERELTAKEQVIQEQARDLREKEQLIQEQARDLREKEQVIQEQARLLQEKEQLIQEARLLRNPALAFFQSARYLGQEVKRKLWNSK